jgi:hypothetical protein
MSNSTARGNTSGRAGVCEAVSLKRSILALGLLWLPAASARAGWFDAAWSCRRTVDVAWNADQAKGDEQAQVELYTGGHAGPSDADVRVATDDGKLVPSCVLAAGPGDRVRLAFDMVKGVKRYAVYFGNPAARPPPGDFDFRSGLLMETKVWTGGRDKTFEQLERAWDRGGPTLGRILIDHAFLGYNPFDDHVQVVSKLTGTLTAPLDGDYLLAMAVDDEGAVYLDNQPTLLAHLGGGDIRYHTTVHLSAGPHPFTLYHVNEASTGYFSVGWKRPNAPKVVVIDKFSFGDLYQQGNLTVGPLEVRGKTLVGDFAADRVAECDLDDRYVFHYRFTGQAHVAVPVRYTWDFGDGQSGEGVKVDHVYLREGVYAVRCAAHAGPNVDEQTSRVVVGRDYAHLVLAREDPPELLSPIVAGYRLADVAPDDLPRAVQLHLAADRPDPALTAATALAALPSQEDPAATLAALTGTEAELLTTGHPDLAIDLWAKVPGSATIRPTAAARAADLALWWTGDAARAVALLSPYEQHGGDEVRRLYGQALLLTGRAADATAILSDLPAKARGSRRAALSGADARTVEFYITEGEPDPGDTAWTRWMTDFPTDFAAGYSVLLRTKLMELRHRDAAAAAVAEAFADAVPTSSYAPQLLDRAAKLLAASDPGKSAALHQRLKEKYPEDPLSQD